MAESQQGLSSDNVFSQQILAGDSYDDNEFHVYQSLGHWENVTGNTSV